MRWCQVKPVAGYVTNIEPTPNEQEAITRVDQHFSYSRAPNMATTTMARCKYMPCKYMMRTRVAWDEAQPPISAIAMASAPAAEKANGAPDLDRSQNTGPKSPLPWCDATSA